MVYWENHCEIIIGGQKFHNAEDLEDACFECPNLIEELEEMCYLLGVREDVDTYLDQVQKEDSFGGRIPDDS